VLGFFSQKNTIYIITFTCIINYVGLAFVVTDESGKPYHKNVLINSTKRKVSCLAYFTIAILSNVFLSSVVPRDFICQSMSVIVMWCISSLAWTTKPTQAAALLHRLLPYQPMIPY